MTLPGRLNHKLIDIFLRLPFEQENHEVNHFLGLAGVIVEDEGAVEGVDERGRGNGGGKDERDGGDLKLGEHFDVVVEADEMLLEIRRFSRPIAVPDQKVLAHARDCRVRVLFGGL